VSQLRFRLVPVDDTFFKLFSDSAENVATASRHLRDLLEDPARISEHHQAIVGCERRGDEIVKALLRRLDSSFVTPFDREDIHALAEELDDVVDDIMAIGALLQMVSPRQILPEMKEQADIMVQMADQVVELVSRLERMRDVRAFLDQIDKLESEGDAVYRRTIARLFSGEFEALEVIMWKDIVQAMETGLNTMEDISNIVESIVLKHA
jgi:predicted phosphate transport protein (TIGR00153 family)